LVPEGVTRKRKRAAATSCSSVLRPARATSRWVRTIRSAPPRRSRVSRRSLLDRPSFLVPEPDEDELEIGRLDLPPAGAARGIRPVEHARAGIGECDPTDLDLVEHALDEHRLRGDGIVGMGCGVEGDRREDRLTRGVP
jgi:hypothetical protein